MGCHQYDEQVEYRSLGPRSACAFKGHGSGAQKRCHLQQDLRAGAEFWHNLIVTCGPSECTWRLHRQGMESKRFILTCEPVPLGIEY